MPARRKPRVALFCANYLPYSQTFIYDEIRRHARYGIEVFAKSRVNAPAFGFEPVNSFFPAHSFGERMAGMYYAVCGKSPRYDGMVRNGDFSLVHAHFGTASVYALPCARAARLPLAVTFHGYDVPLLLTARRYQPKHWRYWHHAQAMLRHTSRFLAASTELANLLAELGAPLDRIFVWRLGVEIPRPAAPTVKTGKKVLMVGRLVEKKGFRYGIEAFADVAGRHPQSTLEIIGSGPLERDLRTLTAELGMADRVRFSGALGHATVLKKIAAADVMIAPSVIAKNGDRESGLIVAKEAAARSVPVIGTRHGGIPEIIDDGKTGFLAPERDPRALAAPLDRLLSDRRLRERLGKAARRKMEKEYDIVKRVADLECHYDEIAAMPWRER